MYRYAAIGIAGRHFYLLLLVAPLWILALWSLKAVGIFNSFSGGDAQVLMMGIPLIAIGIFLGLRIIASEISGRSLEIVYTVPGGSERVWWIKLLAAVLILLPIELLLAIGGWFFLSSFPLLALQGALQCALFFLVLAMGLSVLFRGEIAGAIGTALVLAFFLFVSGFGNNQIKYSPLYNPFAQTGIDPEVLIANTVQNRIGFLLVTLAILGLAFMRSNRREKLLSS